MVNIATVNSAAIVVQLAERAGQVRSLNVVVVNEELPCVPSSDHQVRTLDLMLRLAKRHRLTLLCPGSADHNADLRVRGFFLEHGIRTVVTKTSMVRRSGFGFGVRATANHVFSRLPLSVAGISTPALRQALRQYAAKNPVDLWHCESLRCAHAMRGLSDSRWLVMVHELESRLLKDRRDRETHWLKRRYLNKQLRRCLRFERRVFTEAALTVTSHPQDAAVVKYAFGAANVDVLEGGTDWPGIADRLEQIWLRTAMGSPLPALGERGRQ